MGIQLLGNVHMGSVTRTVVYDSDCELDCVIVIDYTCCDIDIFVDFQIDDRFCSDIYTSIVVCWVCIITPTEYLNVICEIAFLDDFSINLQCGICACIKLADIPCVAVICGSFSCNICVILAEVVEIQSFKDIYTTCVTWSVVVGDNGELDYVAYIDDIPCNCLVYAEINVSGYINRGDVILVVA